MLPVGENHQVNKKCRVFLAETDCDQFILQGEKFKTQAGMG